ncbi:MAG: acyltransferase [Pseudomonadota bacterium]
MNIWQTAVSMAEQTPADRNRYVDFLRAVSILVVIMGHWLIATAWWVDGELVTGHLVAAQPELQWLTWIFQVMPIFFIVGGYANAVSLESADRKGTTYAQWLNARINRLLTPLLVLLVAWAVISFGLQFAGVTDATVQYLSRSALVPTWFLAIYTMVVILAPAAYRLWQKLGYGSVVLFIALAVLTDVLFFAFDLRWPAWANYFWVWLAVHQLGYVWRDGKHGSVGLRIAIGVAGFAILYALVSRGPYPMAMVGSPDEVSNSLPPKITLIALGLFQFGLLLAIEGPMRRVLSNVKTWAATVLINSMIMSIYLWHITVMLAIGGVMYALDGFGFGLEPGNTAWWQSRPLWLAVLWVGLVPVGLLMSPLERVKASSARPAWRQISGAVFMCLGIALLALWGFAGAPKAGFDLAAFACVVVGALLAGLVTLPGRAQAYN